jgi:hypothetical protein
VTQIAVLVLQIFQVLFLWLHDWVPLGPLNNLAAVRSVITRQQMILGTLINGVPFLILLVLSVYHLGSGYPHWLQIALLIAYSILFIGELEAWWLPYLVMPQPKKAERYRKLFAGTHAFLPVRNGMVPNTLHVILHVATLLTLLLLI